MASGGCPALQNCFFVMRPKAESQPLMRTGKGLPSAWPSLHTLARGAQAALSGQRLGTGICP